MNIKLTANQKTAVVLTKNKTKSEMYNLKETNNCE